MTDEPFLLHAGSAAYRAGDARPLLAELGRHALPPSEEFGGCLFPLGLVCAPALGVALS